MKFKGILSTILGVAMVISFSSMFVTADTTPGVDAAVVDISGKSVIKGEVRIVDEDGNIIEQQRNTRAFPCCAKYPSAGVTNKTFYAHTEMGYDLCWVIQQKAPQCNACRYVALVPDKWKDTGAHDIVKEQGKWLCPYRVV